MFGHDDNQDNQSNGGSPFGPPQVKPDPKPDGILDGSIGDALPPKPAGLPFTPPPKKPVESEPIKDNTTPAQIGSDDLLGIKQEALKHLSPLVSHLDQTPEEKFRTTMMMIQAADDEKLIKTAFEAAKQIKDDKSRAQALLDVINEINYFTQATEK